MRHRGLVVSLAVLLRSSLAFAAPPTRVLLVHPGGSDAVINEATLRVSAELVAAGFEPEMKEVRDDGGDDRDEGAAGATIHLFRAASGAVADVRVTDEVSKKTFARRIEIPLETRHAAALLALRAVEQLRASLLESSAEPAPPEEKERPKAAPAVVVARPSSEAEAPRSLKAQRTELLQKPAMQAGAVVMYGVGGFGASFAPMLRISNGIARHFAARVTIFGPTIQGDVATLAGSASIVQAVGEAECVWSWVDADARVVPSISLGVGASYVGVKGSASPGYQAHNQSTVVALVDGGMGVAYRIGARAAIVLDGHALVMVPEPTVRIASTDAGTGRPSLYLSGGFLTQF